MLNVLTPRSAIAVLFRKLCFASPGRVLTSRMNVKHSGGGGGQAEVLPKSAEMGFPPFLYTAHCTRTMLSNIGWARIIRMVGENIWETWSPGSGTTQETLSRLGESKRYLS